MGLLACYRHSQLLILLGGTGTGCSAEKQRETERDSWGELKTASFLCPCFLVSLSTLAQLIDTVSLHPVQTGKEIGCYTQIEKEGMNCGCFGTFSLFYSLLKSAC
jgi:hypothetical protein